jgi:hypothetical protein
MAWVDTRGNPFLCECLASGFYNMALEAQLPLGLVELDYAHKSITFTSFLHLSGDVERDIERVASVYATTQGKYPDLAGPIVWRVKDKAP